MSQHYSNPARAADPHALPDIEVFYIHPRDSFEGSYGDGPGWYWWACFPGCLPDGDPTGPFATEAEAIADAQESNDTDGDTSQWNENGESSEIENDRFARRANPEEH